MDNYLPANIPKGLSDCYQFDLSRIGKKSRLCVLLELCEISIG